MPKKLNNNYDHLLFSLLLRLITQELSHAVGQFEQKTEGRKLTFFSLVVDSNSRRAIRTFSVEMDILFKRN